MDYFLSASGIYRCVIGASFTIVIFVCVAGKLSSDAVACKPPWRCSPPCANQQQQQRLAASLQGGIDHHPQHQTLTGLYAGGVSLGNSQVPVAMSDYAAAAAASGAAVGLLDSKPAILAASMF